MNAKVFKTDRNASKTTQTIGESRQDVRPYHTWLWFMFMIATRFLSVKLALKISMLI